MCVYMHNLGDDTERKFRVNAVSGFMGLIETTTSPLDRETRDSYDLVVSVTDSGTPSRMVRAYVTTYMLKSCCYMLNSTLIDVLDNLFCRVQPQ